MSNVNNNYSPIIINNLDIILTLNIDFPSNECVCVKSNFLLRRTILLYSIISTYLNRKLTKCLIQIDVSPLSYCENQI